MWWSAVIGAAEKSSDKGFWEIAGPALIGLVGVLGVAAVGYRQWRKGQANLLALEAAKRKLEEEKLSWEREKLVLEQRFTLEQQTAAAEEEERRKTTEQERDRLVAARSASDQAFALEHSVRAMRTGVMEDLGRMKILDMSKPLDLGSLYVQVRVREDEYGRYIRDEQVARDAVGDPNTLLASQWEQQRQRAATATAPEDALARFRRIVLLGDPGAGKTTLLRHLAFRLARHDRIGNLEVPLYVELRRFIDAGAASLLDFVAADWARRYGFEGAVEWLDGELSAGRAALLLDGLDEVLAGDNADAAQAAYNTVTEEVNRLATRYPTAAIAVTCRRAGWEGGLHTFQSLEVLDFTWEQVQQFLVRWFRDSPERGHGLTRALAGNLRMQSLAANPLLLSLIAIVYERDLELPERRAELYNRCVEVLLREWDAHRKIQRYTRFTTDRKRDLLEEVAWYFHCAGRRYFPRDELLDVIAQFLPTIQVDPKQSETILEEIAEQYGLIKAQAPGWYGFLHLTLQEYFAAIAAHERQNEGMEVVTGHVGESWWEEVTVLLAGRMADASPLLLALLGRAEDDLELRKDGEQLAVGDDLFCTRLLLTARCLVGTPKIRLPGLRDAIASDVGELLASRWELDRDRAALALAEIGDPDVTQKLRRHLLDDSEDPAQRICVARAFGKTADTAAVEALSGLLARRDDAIGPLAVETVKALGNAHASEARPRLRELIPLPGDQIRDYDRASLAAAAAAALARMQDRESAALMLEATRRLHDNEDEMRSAYVDILIRAYGDALRTLGSQDMAQELLALGTSFTRAPFYAGSLLRAAVVLGGEPVGRQLVALFTSPESADTLSFALSEAVEEINDAYAVSEMVRAIEDERLPWQRRWLIAGHLERFPDEAHDQVVALVDQDLDPRVRISLTAVVGAWGETWVLPRLRDGLKVLPPALEFGAAGFSVRSRVTWGRVTEVLAGQGDDSYIPFLLEQLNDSSQSPPFSRYSESHTAAVYASQPASHRAVAERLLVDVRAAGPDSSSLLDSLLAMLSTVVSAPVARPMSAVLRSMFATKAAPTETDFLSWNMIRVVDGIATHADDAECVADLVGILVTLPRSSQEPLSDACYQALMTLSQRLTVRVEPIPELAQRRRTWHNGP